MMLPPATHLQANPEKQAEGKESGQQTVYIEYCHNCDSHLTVVRHQELKYTSQFQAIKHQLGELGYLVKKRPVPSQLFRRSPYCPPNVYYRSGGEVVYFPQIGAFEVYYGESRVFSKLEKKKWPTADLVSSLIKHLVQEIEESAKLRFSEAPAVSTQRLSRQKEEITLQEKASKTQSIHWRKTPLQNERYSLQKRNLLKSQTGRKRVGRSFNQKSDRSGVEDKEEADIIKMYSPGNKKPVVNGKLRYELEGIPSIEGKTRVRNANVYLEPIYPKSRVSYQNYQKHRVLYTKKIHEEKIAYGIEKEKRAPIEPTQAKKRRSNPKFNKHIVTLNKIKESEESLEPKLVINHIQAVDKRNEKESSCEMQNSLKLPKEEKDDQDEFNSYKDALEEGEKDSKSEKNEVQSKEQEGEGEKESKQKTEQKGQEQNNHPKVSETEQKDTEKKLDEPEDKSHSNNEPLIGKTAENGKREIKDEKSSKKQELQEQEDNYEDAFETEDKKVETKVEEQQNQAEVVTASAKKLPLPEPAEEIEKTKEIEAQESVKKSTVSQVEPKKEAEEYENEEFDQDEKQKEKSNEEKSDKKDEKEEKDDKDGKDDKEEKSDKKEEEKEDKDDKEGENKQKQKGDKPHEQASPVQLQ